MPKRKRGQDDNAKTAVNLSPAERQRAQVEECIEKGKKDLNRAVKISKGFVRQRLGKRQREAQVKQDGAALDKINAEIEKLKVWRFPYGTDLRIANS